MNLKIAICLPRHGDPKGLFVASLNGLLLYSVYSTLPDPLRLDPIYVESSDLPAARNTLAQMAIQRQCDYSLWLDQDHVFPMESLVRLLKHGVDVVGINQRRRLIPGLTAVGLDNRQVESAGKTGLEVVRYTGMGMTLVRNAALQNIEQPWFFGGTEDIFFADKLRSQGIPWHVDHGLSLDVGHIADNVLRIEG